MKAPLLLGLLLCAGTNAWSERAALIIGNADYAETGCFGDLSTTRQDAREMERLLKASSTFDRIVLKENATRLEMEEALANFAADLKKGDEAVFYFAGHGIEYEKKVYLMGTNAEFRLKAKLPEEAVSEETVSQTLAATGAKISVLLLDCCRQKPGGDWLASENKSRGGAGAAYAVPQPPANVIVGYATSAGRLANDSLTESDQNGPLIAALRKHLPAGLEFDALWKAVSREVYAASTAAIDGGVTGIDLQMPSKYGQTIHDFYFLPPGGAGDKPAPALVNSAAPSPPSPTMAKPSDPKSPDKPAEGESLPYGTWVPGWGDMGYVYSPYSEYSGMTDVSKLPVGAKVLCKHTGKYFLVPPREEKSKKGGSVKPGALPVQPAGAGRVVQ